MQIGMDLWTAFGRGGGRTALDRILSPNGEDYAFFDATALDRMWQTTLAQTQAVIGGPVGVVVGREKHGTKSLSAAMASMPELTVNGKFDTDLSNWTQLGGGWTWENGRAHLQGDGSVQSFRNSTLVTTGKAYLVTFDVEVVSGGGIVFENASGVAVAGGGTGTHSCIWIADRTLISFKRTGTIVDGYLDNVSVKELPLHYAQQATAGLRPVLQAAGIKFDGSDDYLTTDFYSQAGATSILLKVAVPATLSAAQYITGMNGSGSGRFRIRINTNGTLGVDVGDNQSGSMSGDLRGTTSIIGVSASGSQVGVFVNGAQTSDVAQAGVPDTAKQFVLGAFNNNGSIQGFFGGNIEKAAFTRTAFNLEQFNQISAEWAA